MCMQNLATGKEVSKKNLTVFEQFPISFVYDIMFVTFFA